MRDCSGRCKDGADDKSGLYDVGGRLLGKKQLEELRAKVENPLKPYYAAGFKGGIEVAGMGEIGKLDTSALVFNIADKNNALIVVSWQPEESGGFTSRTESVSETFSRIQSAAASNRNNVKPERFPKTLMWLKGASTEGLTDQSTIKLDGIFAITSTRQYNTTAGGTKTVFVLERLKIEDDRFTRKVELRAWSKKDGGKLSGIADEDRKYCEARGGVLEREVPKSEPLRTWTSADGKYITEAKLLSYANGTITIQSRDGKKIKIALDKLSKADQDIVNAWRKQR